MSKSKTTSKSASTWDAEALRAQSVAQSMKMIEMVDEADRRSVGTWYRLPRGTETWHYVRCGIKNTDAALAMAWQLRQFGYVEAHPDVRLAGFESDGDRMLVMCAPPETHERRQQVKRKARAKVDQDLRQSLQSDLASLGRHGSVEISGGEGRGTLADFNETVRSTK
tara:strand:- start:1358 stop:1858 length:501 start_codon:yes stop_codon:yes gene_type:complete